ncbi:stalk domain-containing protein [Bacillus sp. Marseille-P3661]|uniref:stalk domain-containing protein n=1 Tax=Bacillus sp. Marseille-P3661 TaxID=1936234 RepID=UPI0015E19438|nr:stalk domain-containing protein [Bacillus sp. Marseille-P3661]
MNAVHKISIQLSTILFLFFVVAPAIYAEEMHGKAILKDLIVEMKNAELKAEDPKIIFEGQTYLPLRVITESLNKKIYVDKKTNTIIIKSDNTSMENIRLESNSDRKSVEPRPNITFTERIKSGGAIVIEDNEQNIMFEKNSHATFYPASTTKILTALIALEKGDLNEEVVVSDNVKQLPIDSRRVFIKPGDVLTLEQLLYATLLYSGNDSALAIAEHIAGSETEFAKLMNEKANELGAGNSHFVNPHGYHHPDHYTTPYDLAVILKAAADHPRFLDIINTSSYKAVYKNKKGKQITRTWRTTNQFLKNSSFATKGVIGGKTGYTDAAGRTLVTVSEYNGHRYFTAILKGTSIGRYKDTKKLLLKAYKHRESYDQSFIKNIDVTPITKSIIVDGQPLPKTKKMFIYNGRTYISQSYVNETLADVQQEDLSSHLTKIKIKPAYVMNSLAIEEISLTASSEIHLKELTSPKNISFKYINPVHLLVGTHIQQFGL